MKNRTIQVAGLGLLVLLFGSRLDGQFVAAKLRQPIDPQYDGTLKDYLVDPVTVKLIVDEFGEPVSLETSAPLPLNVVRAIAAARFDPGTQKGKPVPVSTQLTFGVRREKEYFASIANRPSTDDFSSLRKIIEAGPKLSAKEASSLDGKLKEKNDSVESRASLVGYAAKNEGSEARHLQTRQIAWFVRNQPGSSVLSHPSAMMFPGTGAFQNKEGYDQIRALWLAKLAEQPNAPEVFANAAYFLRLSDPELAERLILPMIDHVGGAATWLGELYAFAALGVTSLTNQGGSAVSADVALPSQGFGRRARIELATSTDARVVLSAFSEVAAAGSSLSKGRSLPQGYGEFCESLLVRAKTFYPELEKTCEIIPSGPGGDVEAGHLTKHPNPAYPSNLRARKIQGTIKLQALIGKDGKIVSLEFLQGALAFLESTWETISTWEYRPTLLNGEPVEVITEITVNYKL